MAKYIAFIVIIISLVIYMNSGRPLYQLSAYTDLSSVDDIELSELDFKKAEGEEVKLKENYPSFHKAGDIGVLIIHGFTGSPLEMQPVADFLFEKGFSVYQVRIAGHGSIPSNLNLTTYQDWYESARYGYFMLKRNCKKVFVMGESMGGLVALSVAAYNETDGAVLLAPCIQMRSKATRLAPLLSKFIKMLPKFEAGDWTKDLKHIYYDKWPAVGIYQLLMYTNYTRENTELFTFPMLGFQYINDAVVSGKATAKFFEDAPSKDKTYVQFPDDKISNHVLVNEKNIYRQDMFDKITEWLNERGK